MSNVLTLWVKEELYPTLFHKIDEALPEHSFKRFAGGWRSKTYLDGSLHKDRQDKTVVSKQAPAYILEQGGDVVSLVSYVMKRDKVDFIQAVKTLAKVVGLQPPSLGSNIIAYSKIRDRAQLLEDCNRYFIYCLDSSPHVEYVGSPDKILPETWYLSNRGYIQDEIKSMELGYIPSQESLFKYLTEKGYSKELIDETLNIKTDTRIGASHRLTIPYRSGGSIKGFKFRTIGDATPKYLNSKGLDKSGGFFNLLGIKGDKDIVIVEGELDALHATVKGVENVVATGGSSISPEQIKDAVKRGAKSFTLCFDKDEAGIKATDKAIDVILAEGVNRVYTVTLPDTAGGKTDVDQLIKDKGVEAFKKALAQAIPYYEYRLRSIYSRYAARELNERDIHNLEDEVVSLSSGLEPLDRDKIIKLFTDQTAVKDWGISKESLEITIDRIRATKDKEAQAKDLKRLLSEATTLQAQGDTTKALELLDKQSKQIKATSGKELLPPPMRFTTLLDEIATLPPAYKTGYSSLDKFVGFTSGAISLIAGRPSHGKTTLLFNLLLEMSKLYKDESFYFFTYEEPVKNLSIKLLNRLTATDLSGYFREYNLSKPTNYEFLKAYVKGRRTDIEEIETGKELFKELVDSQRIRIIDKNYSVEELSNLIAYVNKKEKIGGVFIDYIQRMRTERKTQDKRTEIAHISDQVLQIAKESGLPIILGAQLNRATVSSGNKKPALENLKEAGNLEEDANTVLSVYNESREKEDSPDGESDKVREVELEIKALKNREGEVNQSAKLTFDKWTGVIKDSSSGSSYFK